jgi:transcriptional regulator with XRE-family HTH domain
MKKDQFGSRLEQFRSDAGLSQTQLAKAVGTSQSAVSQMESGERKPSFDMLRRLAKALKVSPAHLLGEEVEELRPEEQAYFRQFRSLPDDAKKELSDFAEYLRQKHKK